MPSADARVIQRQKAGLELMLCMLSIWPPLEAIGLARILPSIFPSLSNSNSFPSPPFFPRVGSSALRRSQKLCNSPRTVAADAVPR